MAYIKDHPAFFPVEHVDVPQLRKGWSTLNEPTTETADITVPIILAEISPNQFNVIDGNHRLEKAYRSGVATIPAYRVMVEQHLPFLGSKEAYRTYVQYWNSKIDSLNERQCHQKNCVI